MLIIKTDSRKNKRNGRCNLLFTRSQTSDSFHARYNDEYITRDFIYNFEVWRIFITPPCLPHEITKINKPSRVHSIVCHSTIEYSSWTCTFIMQKYQNTLNVQQIIPYPLIFSTGQHPFIPVHTYAKKLPKLSQLAF